ncbi:unnamed protein product [Pleuronectes platessa]|uniref:Uncharacterized protein n=1 Tax=Pleuronectes platessa TaxID=8262 RepID=A0A9N7VR20_PLEPL|nr:unnamed protein product [Pleuronectes platessa]
MEVFLSPFWSIVNARRTLDEEEKEKQQNASSGNRRVNEGQRVQGKRGWWGVKVLEGRVIKAHKTASPTGSRKATCFFLGHRWRPAEEREKKRGSGLVHGKKT